MHAGVSRSQFFKFLADGSIRSIKVGRLRRIPVSEIEAWVARQLEQQTANNQYLVPSEETWTSRSRGGNRLMTLTTSPLLDEALAMWRARKGNVWPPAQDGSKRPDRQSWTELQHRRVTEAELRTAYGDLNRTGVGVFCGPVSGGLALFEFDDLASALPGVRNTHRGQRSQLALAADKSRVLGTESRRRTAHADLHAQFRPLAETRHPGQVAARDARRA